MQLAAGVLWPATAESGTACSHPTHPAVSPPRPTSSLGRPDGPASSHPDCYDFELEVPRSFELPPYAAKAAGKWHEVEALDAQLNASLGRLAEHRRRRTMLLAFAQSPVDFINAMVAAQVRAGCVL